MFWRYLPLAGIVLLILIAGCIRPLLQLKLHGTTGFFLFRSGRPAQMLRDALLVLLIGGFLFQAIAGPRRPALLRLLVTEGSTAYEVLQVVGATLIIGGVILFASAQLNLGASWQVGIDERHKPGMVSNGLYSYSRHPIFLGFLTLFTGYAAMLPTALSLILLLGAYIGFRTQADTEEAYMLRTYGDPYRDYTRRVGRFLPGVGKL